MKKYLILALIALVGAFKAAAFIDSYVIDRSKLPQEAQEMLTEHFPKAKVANIKIDRHLLKKTEYVVKLVNGSKIEFSNKGKWKTVDCGKRAVPEKLVPEKINSYVKKNHKKLKITSIEKKSLGYRIGLSDGTVHKFDLLGSYKGLHTDADKDDDADEADDSTDL